MKNGIYEIIVEGKVYFELYFLGQFEGMFATLEQAENCQRRFTDIDNQF